MCVCVCVVRMEVDFAFNLHFSKCFSYPEAESFGLPQILHVQHQLFSRCAQCTTHMNWSVCLDPDGFFFLLGK